MPTFCRHNRFLQNCPICSREQEEQLRPLVTPSAGPSPPPTRPRRQTRPTRLADVRVRRLARGLDDGYHSRLLPGLKYNFVASEGEIRPGVKVPYYQEDLSVESGKIKDLGDLKSKISPKEGKE